jgi:hypothetical protein
MKLNNKRVYDHAYEQIGGEKNLQNILNYCRRDILKRNLEELQVPH